MAKKAKSVKSVAQPWFEQVFDAMDFSDVSRGAGLDLEAEPAWAVKVLRELVQQAMPTVQIRKPKQIAPRDVGQCLGQMCANMYAIGDLMSQGAGISQQTNGMMKAFMENQHLPAVKSVVECMESAGRFLEALIPNVERFEEVVIDAFRAALDQPSRTEASEFFRGFADGISKPGITNRARFAAATTATPIYGRLFMERRRIEQLKSVRELREFLLQRGLSEQILGDSKRLEKLCERIGLSFAPRGRKKRAK